MSKLAEILKDLEQGKISADRAEEQILDLFGDNQMTSHKEREEQERQFFFEGSKRALESKKGVSCNKKRKICL